ncbi:MAG: TatD family hydrolase [Candidatus Polarisedimenticolia bacterium]
MSRLADAHAHLAMAVFQEDLDAVMARAWDGGVRTIVTCATSWSDMDAQVSLARAHGGRGLRGAVGIHPHQASQWSDGGAARLAGFVEAHTEIVAIGEVGLDYHYSRSPHEAQREALRAQIGVARSTGLPLVIHCRAARQDLAAILEEERVSEVGGMLHCFSEDAPFARRCLDLGLHVSFSGIVTFKKADEIRDAARLVPLDRLLVETDAPYLAPEPRRGGRNEPARVADVARALAAFRGEPYERLAEATAANAERLFAGRPSAGKKCS